MGVGRASSGRWHNATNGLAASQLRAPHLAKGTGSQGGATPACGKRRPSFGIMFYSAWDALRASVGQVGGGSVKPSSSAGHSRTRRFFLDERHRRHAATTAGGGEATRSVAHEKATADRTKLLDNASTRVARRSASRVDIDRRRVLRVLSREDRISRSGAGVGGKEDVHVDDAD